MREAGLELKPAYLVRGDFQIEGGETGIMQLMRVNPRPSAVFVCSDMMAIGAIRGALQLGIRVPADLSLVGFDDIALAHAMSPALTTMAQPVPDMARSATELLIQRMKGELGCENRQRIVLPARLVIRDSCSRWNSEE